MNLRDVARSRGEPLNAVLPPESQASAGWILRFSRPIAEIRAVVNDARARYNPAMELLDRITHDPTVMGGRPCIRGMRVTVGTIMGLLASGRTQAEILAAYPYLEAEDVQAALAYAAWRTKEVDLPLT